MASAIPTTDGIAGEQRTAPGTVFASVAGTAIDEAARTSRGRHRTER